MSKKQFGLVTVKKDLAGKSTNFLKDIQKEIVKEETEALRDFIKGAYRLKMEKEKELEAMKKEIEKIDGAITEASKGNWDDMQKIKIPARFFNEATLRKHGKSLLEGNQEIRFVDLYETEE